MIRRSAPGSYAQQIAARELWSWQGGKSKWGEAEYVRGISLPPAAQAREDVIWDALLGGPGSFTRTGKDFAELGVYDQTVKLRSTALGNNLPVPDSVSYAPFVTGGIGVKPLSLSRMAKPAKAANRSKVKTGKTWSGIKLTSAERKIIGSASEYSKSYAMWWFLGFTFHYWPTDQQMKSGIMVPPKRVSPNPDMWYAILDEFQMSMIGAKGGGRGMSRADLVAKFKEEGFNVG